MKTGHQGSRSMKSIYKHAGMRDEHRHEVVLIRWVEAACSGCTCIRKQSVSRTNYFSSLCSLGTLEEAMWWKGGKPETVGSNPSSVINCLT